MVAVPRLRSVKANDIVAAAIVDGILILKRYDYTTLMAELGGGEGGGLTETEVNALITAQVNLLLDGAPAALNTLNELAAAVGDDASFSAAVTTALAGKQPLNAGLTAIAALNTTALGRSLLAAADPAALQAIVDAQPASAQLTSLAALTTTAIGRSLLEGADAAALRTIIGAPADGSMAPVVVRKSNANLTLAVDANYQDIDPSGTANARELDIVIPNAVAGKWIVGGINVLITSSTVAAAMDFFTIVAGVPIHKFGDPTSLTGAAPGSWQPEANKTLAIMGSVPYQIQADDIESGSVRIRMRSRQTSGAARIIFSGGGGLLIMEGRGPF